ncbi:Bre4p [Sugiyamaella lignohabitans]|uniref:Bre4p n=1 Tax=Sugiyamaella lignohabitans TaxID=796027 RepID=A0A167FQZ3_9ASCO|nr:Bre4p [Sugiyamaella lignohabitans]ANB15586.1 Bre4p [Sugiyamaella lignohabitans]
MELNFPRNGRSTGLAKDNQESSRDDLPTVVNDEAPEPSIENAGLDRDTPVPDPSPRNKFLDIEDTAFLRPSPNQLGSHHSAESVPIYRGSYAHTSHASLKSYAEAMAIVNPDGAVLGSGHGNTPCGPHELPLHGDRSGLHSGVATPRSAFVEPKMSYLQAKLETLFGNQVKEERVTYGIEELRNGFFDAIFVPPTIVESAAKREFIGKPSKSLSDSGKSWINSWIKSVRKITVQTEQIKLLKTFLAYFLAYILCMIGPTGRWLGRYNLFMAFAVLIHHPGRTSGSQIEISFWSILGIAIGLGWGSTGLYIASSTHRAAELFGLIHAFSLTLCLVVTCWIKAAFVRLHHFMTSLALAVYVLEVANVSESTSVDWMKAWQFGIPYLFGILISLAVNILVFPDFGHQDIMFALKVALQECIEATKNFYSNEEEISVVRDLTKASLDLSEAVRGAANEITISTLQTKELVNLRNSIQVGIARIRAVPSPSSLYTSGNMATPAEFNHDGQIHAANIIRYSLKESSTELIAVLAKTIQICIDYVSYLENGKNTAENYNKSHNDIFERQLFQIEKAIAKLSHAYASVLRSDSYSLTQSPDQELFEILLHIYYLAEAGKSVLLIGREFQKTSKKRSWKLSLPNYPMRRALRRSTGRIIRDLGGKTAMHYYSAKKDVDEIFQQINAIDTSQTSKATDGVVPLASRGASHAFRYKTWEVLHRLQGEETRYSLKTVISVVLISVPAWLTSSNSWYNDNDCWISGIFVMIIMTARVGGIVTDFLVFSILCLTGSIWAGLGFRADEGNPYVLSVFCAIFMIPCLFRHISTSHPRSGMIGCMAFTLVSLSLYDRRPIRVNELFASVYPRVLSCEVGVVVSLLINWIMWPFVARHEVRKSMSILLSNISRTYLLVSDRYLYRDQGDEPTPLALQLSEICENRVHRSMFVLQEMIEMAPREPSLRGTFDGRPYSKMLECCEAILQNLIAARINSTHFNIYEFDPQGPNGSMSHQLMSLRRDSVAALLFVFYILAGAFRSKQEIPHYLPSAPMARKLLFDHMAELELHANGGVTQNVPHDHITATERSKLSRLHSTDTKLYNRFGSDEKLMWALVHETAFSNSFTKTAEELEKLIGYSKRILGEQSI